MKSIFPSFVCQSVVPFCVETLLPHSSEDSGGSVPIIERGLGGGVIIYSPLTVRIPAKAPPLLR